MVSMTLRELFLVLNGEYPTLAFSEVLAILQATEINYSNTKEFDQLMKISTSIDSINAIARRSALVHRCCIQLFESLNTVEEILNNAKNALVDYSLISGKNFSVRIKRIKNHSSHIDKVDLERKLGAVLFNHLKKENGEIKVNLETPDISFYGVLTENKFFFGISIWKSETYFQRFDARRGPFNWIALDHIRIYGPLCKKLDISQFPGLFLKYFDEGGPDDLALPLRGSDPLQLF